MPAGNTILGIVSVPDSWRGPGAAVTGKSFVGCFIMLLAGAGGRGYIINFLCFVLK